MECGMRNAECGIKTKKTITFLGVDVDVDVQSAFRIPHSALIFALAFFAITFDAGAQTGGAALKSRNLLLKSASSKIERGHARFMR
jgi:hypothetical protein